MDKRMGTYGSRILAPYGPYPNTAYASPLKYNDYYSKLNEQIDNISFELKSKSKKNRELQLFSNLVSLVDSMALKKQDTKEKTVDPPVNTEINQILTSFQKQQDLMLQLMNNINKKPEVVVPTYNKDEKLYQEYQKIKTSPEEVKKILAELDFDDDGAEDYADKERTLKYDYNLTDEEKLKIFNKISKAKVPVINEKTYKTKGKSRFRVIGFVVLLPIYLISCLLQTRSNASKENLETMGKSIEIYTGVAKDWVLKAMRSALISIVNDDSLDLMLTNKESDIRNQSINIKVIKLQVRITGILEGLENLTNNDEMPIPFRKFMDKFTSDRSYLPKDYPTGFEKSRLEFHEFGGLINQTEDKKKMMICFFFITKILVKQICLKPIESGLRIAKNSRTVT
jgi:hypothetical protein